MKSFLLIYKATPDIIEQMDIEYSAKSSTEILADWKLWEQNNIEHIVDMGAPVDVQNIFNHKKECIEQSDNVIGFSKIKARDLAHAQEILHEHPLLKYGKGITISIYENVDM